MEKANPAVKAEILNVLENQMRDNEPSETKQAFDRLIKEINDRNEVMRLLGCVLTSEIFIMLQNKEAFNRKRFVDHLNKLPDLSWID